MVFLIDSLKSLLKSHLGLVSLRDVHRYNTRNARDFHLHAAKTNLGKQRVPFHTAKDWNSLSLNTRNCITIARFRSKMLAKPYLYFFVYLYIP